MDIQSERETLRQLDTYYDDFKGWAEEFEQASLPRKRMILCQLFEKIEVGKGYKVICHARMSYQQFIEQTKNTNRLKNVAV